MIKTVDISDTRTVTPISIADQNDRFRASWGSDPTVQGRILVTAGVAALGAIAALRIIATVRSFDRFTEDNDPHGEHDFGAFEISVDGLSTRLFWKIDLYDAEFVYGSEAPGDPKRTRRVLTILLPSEY